MELDVLKLEGKPGREACGTLTASPARLAAPHALDFGTGERQHAGELRWGHGHDGQPRATE